MKKEISVNVEQEVLSLVTDITYSCVPDWYDAVYTDLKMNLIIPKHREAHEKMPAILWLCGGIDVFCETWLHRCQRGIQDVQ